MILAAIDLGTVTSRLLIGDLSDGKIENIDCRVSITDLGEGLTSSGKISHAASMRLMNALSEFREAITSIERSLQSTGSEQTVIPIKIVATSAMRDATNAAELLAAMNEAGFEVEVISGKREAELSFSGTLSGFDVFGDVVMSVDVGGGSTEIIYGSSDANIQLSESFDMGSRRITETFLLSDPPERSQIHETYRRIKEMVGPFLAALPGKPTEVIAVAGTATSAITIRDSIARYDRKLVHGRRINLAELEELISMLSSLSLEKRRQVIGLHPGRAPVIVGGLIVLSVVLGASGRESLLISDTDILQGIILDRAAIC